MLELLVYLMFFPIIIAFKMIGVADFFWKL